MLRSAGARCREGAAQEILKQCPPERFCKLPGGEVCVYGLPQAAQMTQVSRAEWQSVLGVLAPAPPGEPAAGPGWASAAVPGAVGLAIGFVLALLVARRRSAAARSLG